MEGTRIDDSGLAQLSGLAGLTSLRRTRTRVTGAGLRAVERMKQRAELDLAYTGVDDERLAHLSSLRNLRRLSLDFTRVTDAGLAALRHLDKLAVLNLNKYPTRARKPTYIFGQ